MSDIFDLVVIGAGSGGVRAARFAAGFGARVAIVEKRFFGGTCVNVGCVPKKMFAYAAEVPLLEKLYPSYGYKVDISSVDWATLRNNKTREIERLNGIYETLLSNSGVTIFNGHGKVEENNTVSIDGQRRIHAKNILIATGGTPFVPEIDGKEHVLISDDLFYLPTLPQKVAVVGGGYIATEFSSILNGLGVETYQIYRGDSLLRGFDGDIRNFITERTANNGVHLLLNSDVMKVKKESNNKVLTLSDNQELVVNEVIYATGRVPNMENLFAAAMMPKLTVSGKIHVNKSFSTSINNIYAVGDIIEGPELTPVALAEGMWLARHLFQQPQAPLNYEMIPTAVFCHPNIGTVGISEEKAREQYSKIDIYRSEFRPLQYTLSELQERTLMKLVVDAETDKVLGLHMAGDGAGEITQGFAVAMRMGATKADFDATIGIHPTSAEEFVTMRTPNA